MGPKFLIARRAGQLFGVQLDANRGQIWKQIDTCPSRAFPFLSGQRSTTRGGREVSGQSREFGTYLDSSGSVRHLTPMCNRFRSIKEWSDIPRRFHSGPRLNFEFNPNVAPTELVPILVAGQGVVLARFGINRLGSGDKPRPPLLNVRTDGMRKGQFRKHLKERRCVIPCEGFYEWRDEGGKQPYYFSRKDGKPLMLAGIWEIAEYKGDSRVAFAILTDEPNELVASYHDRMPLSLADDKVAVWLDLANESPLGGNLLLDLKEFTVRPMDRAMNNVRQKNLAAIDPEAAAA